MGNRLAILDMSQKMGAVPLWGELGSHVTQCGLGLGLSLCQVASWSIQPFGHNTWAEKRGGEGAAVPSFFRLDRPPYNNVAWAEAYLRMKWHLDQTCRLATTDMGWKLRGCAPLRRGGAGPHLTQCDWGRVLTDTGVNTSLSLSL